MFSNPPPSLTQLPPPNFLPVSGGGTIMHRMDIPPPIVTKPPPPIPLKNILGAPAIPDPRIQRMRANLTMPPALSLQSGVKLDSPKQIPLDSTATNYLKLNNENVIIIPDPDLILNFTM